MTDKIMPKLPSTLDRSYEEILEQYEVERELANRLRNSNKEERCALYTAVYDELFKKIPNHPQLTRKVSVTETLDYVRRQMLFLTNYLTKDSVFLEVGPGDCSLSLKLCEQVRDVYAVDVSNEITKNKQVPDNFNLFISDGTSIPVEKNVVDIAYSNQLMEHLHPDDAYNQLENIYASIKSDGIYICDTPNGLTGPHDISVFFDDVATGFHLKEYTYNELKFLFEKVGFRDLSVILMLKSNVFKLPLFPFIFIEKILFKFPISIRKRLARTVILDRLLDIRIVAKK